MKHGENNDVHLRKISHAPCYRFADRLLDHAIYLKGGYQVHHIGYGFENNLPGNVKNLIKSQYKGYNISRSYIVDQDNRTIWMVSLQSPSDYIMAGIADGRITEVSRLKNSTASSPVTSMIKRR